MLRTAVPLVFASLVAAQGWVNATPTSPLTRPANRAFGAMTWDPVHDYALLFGGLGAGLGNQAPSTWTWDGSSWTQHATASPTGSFFNYGNPSRAAMAFDPQLNQVVMFFCDSTYGWNGSAWASLPIANPSLTSGYCCDVAMGHDPVRNQTLLFVGNHHIWNGFASYAGETYVLNGAAWVLQSTSLQPWPARYPSMAFDASSGRLVMATSGDFSAGPGAFFEWTGSDWVQRLVAGGPMSPGALVADTTHGDVVMFDGDLATQPAHTWRYRDGVVTALGSANAPAPRFGAMLAHDPTRHRTVLFGGTNYMTTSSFLPLGDTWEFELGAGPSYATYGAGCPGSRGVPTLAARSGSSPQIGHSFELALGNLPFTGPVFLFLGLSDTSYGPTPLPYSLGGLGAPGCSILCSGEAPYLLTNVLGSALWSWNVPNVPGVSFYNQAFGFDPAANALGLSASNAGRGTIGF
ncbi:MAG: hypothetical protein H6838_04805 [Planctomycetes bacterium]|nr:hypothetical protein [Planctomycetota bacterium]